MSQSQTNNSSPSNPNNPNTPNNPSHVVPEADGRISAQGYTGSKGDGDDGEVQFSHGHGGFTSREVDQWRTRRSGWPPPLTQPLSEFHVGFGGSSVGTRSVHDKVSGMDVDWECAAPDNAAPTAVPGMELVDSGGVGVALQSTADDDDDQDLDDLPSSEQPRHGQLYGHVQLKDDEGEVPLYGHVQRGTKPVDEGKVPLYGHVQRGSKPVDEGEVPLYGHVQRGSKPVGEGEVPLYGHVQRGSKPVDEGKVPLYGHVQRGYNTMDVHRSSGGNDHGTPGRRSRDDNLDAQVDKSTMDRGRLRTRANQHRTRRSTSSQGQRLQRTQRLMMSTSEVQPHSHLADVEQSDSWNSDDEAFVAELKQQRKCKLSTMSGEVSATGTCKQKLSPTAAPQHQQQMMNIEKSSSKLKVTLGLLRGSSRRRLGGPTAPVPSCVRYDGVEHYVQSTSQGRCAFCSKNTTKRCAKCLKRLHADCFELFHTAF